MTEPISTPRRTTRKCSRCLHWGAEPHSEHQLVEDIRNRHGVEVGQDERWRICSQHPAAFANADHYCGHFTRRT